MKLIFRIVTVAALFIVAISFYAMGQQAGAFVLVMLGFCIEGLAWWLAFKKKQNNKSKIKSGEHA